MSGENYAMGSPQSARVLDPDQDKATVVGLLRALLFAEIGDPNSATDQTDPVTDPNTTVDVSESGLLRGVLLTLLLERQEIRDRLDGILSELQAQSAMQAAAFDIADGPDAYRT